MALTWEKAVKLARDRAQLDEDGLRTALRAQRVSSQTVTNWKGGRPIPVAQYPVLAHIIGVSIDELHGKTAVNAAPRAADDPDSIARRIANLDDGPRRVLLAMLHELEAQRAPRRKAASR